MRIQKCSAYKKCQYNREFRDFKKLRITAFYSMTSESARTWLASTFLLPAFSGPRKSQNAVMSRRFLITAVQSVFVLTQVAGDWTDVLFENFVGSEKLRYVSPSGYVSAATSRPHKFNVFPRSFPEAGRWGYMVVQYRCISSEAIYWLRGKLRMLCKWDIRPNRTLSFLLLSKIPSRPRPRSNP